MHPKDLSITDFSYVLPPERIAQFPLEERDQSKLLIYDDGKISEDIFANITEHLPENSLLVFNDTKVIHARMVFKNANDASVEIFLLEPVEPARDMQLAIFTHETCLWRCLIGNVKKWREEFLFKKIKIGEEKILLEVWLKGKIEDDFLVEFKWDHGEFSFAQILDAAGFVPLPPYIKRKSEEEDESRYQTVYAVQDGSVAAPTAGLHFTESLFKKLKEKKIQSEFVTLHVSAGTFLPVKSSRMQDHHMHQEQMVIKKSTVAKLQSFILEKRESGSLIIAVGTTSLRVLESLYWLEKRISAGNESLMVDQWQPYDDEKNTYNTWMSLQPLLDLMNRKRINQIVAETRLLVTPGYDFKIADGLITNFHLPKSTLLLLIAALIGDDWRKVYDYALKNDFRFLSYGDGSLLWRK